MTLEVIIALLRVAIAVEWAWGAWVYLPAFRRAWQLRAVCKRPSNPYDVITVPIWFLCCCRLFALLSGQAVGVPPLMSDIDAWRRVLMFFAEGIAAAWLVRAKYVIRGRSS